MGTKKRRIYDKGSPFKGAAQRFGGGSCPKLPPRWQQHGTLMEQWSSVGSQLRDNSH